MITALQSSKIRAANLLVDARETLFTVQNNMYFAGDDVTDLRSMAEKLDEILSRLVTNDKPE